MSDLAEIRDEYEFLDGDDRYRLLIDLGRGRDRMGGSILAQVTAQLGTTTPDVDSPAELKGFWNAIQALGRRIGPRALCALFPSERYWFRHP